MDNKVYHTHVGIVNIMLYLCRKDTFYRELPIYASLFTIAG